MIIYIQFRSSVPLKRFIDLMVKFGYHYSNALDNLNLLGLVISTEYKRLLVSSPKKNHNIMYLETVFELELLPTVESLETLLWEMFGHPSDA